MGRVITTLFEFKEQWHSAVVSITEHPEGHTFNVALHEDTLVHLIPTGRFSFVQTGRDGSLQLETSTRLPQGLLLSLFKSLEGRIERSREDHQPKD